MTTKNGDHDGPAKKTGFSMIPHKLSRAPELTVYDKTLFLVIASFKPSYPSYEYIRRVTGMARGTIAKSLKNLVRWGLLKFESGKNGRRSNWYWVTDEKLWLLPNSNSELGSNSKFTGETANSTPGEPQPVHGLNTNNTNEEYQTKNSVQFHQEVQVGTIPAFADDPILNRAFSATPESLQYSLLAQYPDHIHLKAMLREIASENPEGGFGLLLLKIATRMKPGSGG